MELESDVFKHEFKFNKEGEWDTRSDDYKPGNNGGADSDAEEIDVQTAAYRYEANSEGFEFTSDGENIVLRFGILFKKVDEF